MIVDVFFKQKILEEVFPEAPPLEPSLPHQTSDPVHQLSSEDHVSTSSQIIDDPEGVTSASTLVVQLRDAVVSAGQKRGLEMTNYFVGKIMELWQALGRRHGVIIVGEPMAGKTEAREVLAAALNAVSEEVSNCYK